MDLKILTCKTTCELFNAKTACRPHPPIDGMLSAFFFSLVFVLLLIFGIFRSFPTLFVIILATEHLLQKTFLLFFLLLVDCGQVDLLINRRLQRIDEGVFEDLHDRKENIRSWIIYATFERNFRSESFFRLIFKNL